MTDRLLVNTFGTYGGNSADNDGATVEFSWPGVPVATYVNRGCLAPFIPLSAAGSANGQSICGSPVDLEGQVGGSFVSFFWSGGAGVFSQPDSLLTTYTPAVGEGPVVTLSFCVVGAMPGHHLLTGRCAGGRAEYHSDHARRAACDLWA